MILADMPWVTAAMLKATVDRYRSSSAIVVASRYGSAAAPPTLFDRTLFPELLALADDLHPRRVVRRHGERTSTLRWPEGALRDLDLPADYRRAVTELEVRHGAKPA